MKVNARWAAFAIVVVFVPFGACGGKTTTVDGEDGGDASPSPPASSAPEASVPFDAGGRICPSSCAVGHQCCMGGCGGLPVPMPSDCCSCLADEVSSTTCSNGMCGN